MPTYSFNKPAASGGGNASGLQLDQVLGELESWDENVIRNGAMEIATRGISFTSVANTNYTLDGFRYGSTGTAVVDIASSTSAPAADPQFRSSLRVTCTTADASIAAGEFYYITQPVEGFQVSRFIGATFTLGFWVFSALPGTYTGSIRNGAADRSFCFAYIINSANTWQYIEVSVPGGLITAGTWDFTNGAGIYVSWSLAAGATYTAAPGSWQVGNFIASPGQVNMLGTAGNIFAITGVRLMPGACAKSFRRRNIASESVLNARYLRRYVHTGPGYWVMNFGAAGQGHSVNLCGSVPMRAAPNMSVVTSTVVNGSISTHSLSASTFGISLTASAAGLTYATSSDIIASAEF